MPPPPGRERPHHDQPGFYISAAVGAGSSRDRLLVYLPGSFSDFENVAGLDMAGAEGDPRVIASVAVVIGVVMAAGILSLTGYYTGTDYRPVKDVGKTSLTGPATVILSGLSVGFESAVYTTLVIGAAVFGAFLLGGATLTVSLFAVALAGCGLLTTVGVIVAMDTFGPVSDNAQGIAEMSGDVSAQGAQFLTERCRRQHDQGHHQGHRDRDRGPRGDRSLRLLLHLGLRGGHRRRPDRAPSSRPRATSRSSTRACWSGCSSARPSCSCSPAWPSTRSVARPAPSFRGPRQFREIPGIMDGTGRPEYGKVVDIVTRTRCASWSRPACSPCSLRSPSVRSRRRPLAGFLAGAIGAGTLMAVFLANAGGAWDNAKSWSRTATTAARVPRPTRPRSSATPSATRSRTPLVRPSTR